MEIIRPSSLVSSPGVYCFKTLYVEYQQTRDIEPMLGHRLRRWPNIGSMSRLSWDITTQKTRNVEMLF